jgi:uncharacterized protein YegP (UPF0339 family)
MGLFIILKRINGEFQFNLKADNSEIILTSEGYTSLANCEKGIASVRANVLDDSHFERLIAANQKHYFNLKAANGEIIGTSQMYADWAYMENGIFSVKQNAPEARVITV